MNKFKILFLCLITSVILFVGCGQSQTDGAEVSDVSIQNLTTCHLVNPIGIDETIPTFSWQMSGQIPDMQQSAYRIILAKDEASLVSGAYIWDSTRIESDTSINIPYGGTPLQPEHRYYWQVTVWDSSDETYRSQETAYFETGLLNQGMGDAKWISAASDDSYSHNMNETSYHISYEMEINNTAAGFIFGANQGRYGTMYVCRITDHSEGASFLLQRMNNGGFDTEWETEPLTFSQTENHLYRVNLQVNQSTLTVTVNDEELGIYTIEETPLGSIGYYKSRGVSYAYLDNLLVADTNGHPLYEEDFSKTDTIFSPYYTALENQRLKIGSGMLLTPGYEDVAPTFRRSFTLKEQEIKQARLYMTALGSFAISCNGQPVSDDYFAPGKLAYNQALSYVTYDVTASLQAGQENVVGLTLLHSWYDRAVGYPETWNPWGTTNALCGKLTIEYADGSRETIFTNEAFKYNSDGPVRFDDIYHGEFYDATKELTGYDCAGYDDSDWLQAEVNQIDSTYLDLPLIGKQNEPIRQVAAITPISMTEPAEHVYVYDFGQNFAGTCQAKLSGKSGQTVTFRYGEALNTENLANKDDVVGTIWTESLLTAEATDYYVLNGAPEGEFFSPEYTFHGFRYLQITGLDSPPALEDIQGIVLSSDLTQTGSFECSDEVLNQYYQNTIWSQRSNFFDNPMDCPQRDERHGWAGDAQIFSLAASYHMDTYCFYRKYLTELRMLQSDGGSYSDMAPRNFATEPDGKGGNSSNNCWGDASMVICWNLYNQYGDITILEENYDALCKWMDMLINSSDDYIRNQGGYGDHLSTEDTPTNVSDTAWCAHSADLLSKIATVLNKPEDALHYQEIFENYKQAWQNAFVQPDGITICNTQTSYALGLSFDLFKEEQKAAAAAQLNLLAEYSGNHVHTGFSGIDYILPAYSENGYLETAYNFLLQKEYPSLLYPATRGATTIPEQLAGYRPNEDGTYTLDGSLNHYAYGSPVDWIYTNILGIRSDSSAPGYKHIIISPQPGGNLTYAKGCYMSAYGPISVSWEQTEDGYQLHVSIPANTTATVILTSNTHELGSGSYDFHLPIL